MICRKFFGKPKGSKATGQQSTLAFNRSKGSKATNEDERDEDDVVQPTKKRKVSNNINKEDNDGDVVMEDGTATKDVANGVNAAMDPGTEKGVDRQDSDILDAKG